MYDYGIPKRSLTLANIHYMLLHPKSGVNAILLWIIKASSHLSQKTQDLFVFNNIPSLAIEWFLALTKLLHLIEIEPILYNSNLKKMRCFVLECMRGFVKSGFVHKWFLWGVLSVRRNICFANGIISNGFVPRGFVLHAFVMNFEQPYHSADVKPLNVSV